MSIFTKRNAAVGYIALKALERRRRRGHKRSGIKLALYVGLGLISLGVLAGVAAVLLRRHNKDAEVSETPAWAQAERDEAETEIVGEYVTPAPEPIPAT